jgi:predicted dienelactone hydrolase
MGRPWVRISSITVAAIAGILLLASIALRQFLAIVGRTSHPVVEATIAGREVALWKPAGTPPAEGFPLILFSHGFTGCGTQSVFLTEALAEAGYFVLAPNHHDAACGPGHEGKLFEKLSTLRSEEPFHNPEAWSEATYRDRGADLEAVLDAVTLQKSYQGLPVDSRRVGLVGHSLGGYTVLALAGAWPTWKDGRVRAVVALSPYCLPFIQKGTLRHLDVPVMYQGGTLDLGITPFVQRQGGAYDLTSRPKYFIDFAGAGHFAWTNLNRNYQLLIDDYVLAFFDLYLKKSSDPLAHLLERPWPKDVKDLRYATK